jgi:hypothetical protein
MWVPRSWHSTIDHRNRATISLSSHRHSSHIKLNHGNRSVIAAHGDTRANCVPAPPNTHGSHAWPTIRLPALHQRNPPIQHPRIQITLDVNPHPLPTCIVEHTGSFTCSVSRPVLNQCNPRPQHPSRRMIAEHLVPDASGPYLTRIINTAEAGPGSIGSWSRYGQHHVRHDTHPVCRNKETEDMYTRDWCIA